MTCGSWQVREAPRSSRIVVSSRSLCLVAWISHQVLSGATMRSVPPLPSTPQRACTMESAAKPSHATTMFWFCFAMFGPPILALCVRAVWTAVGAEPAPRSRRRPALSVAVLVAKPGGDHGRSRVDSVAVRRCPWPRRLRDAVETAPDATVAPKAAVSTPTIPVKLDFPPCPDRPSCAR